jgi:hypothetical protein
MYSNWAPPEVHDSGRFPVDTLVILVSSWIDKASVYVYACKTSFIRTQTLTLLCGSFRNHSSPTISVFPKISPSPSVSSCVLPSFYMISFRT